MSWDWINWWSRQRANDRYKDYLDGQLLQFTNFLLTRCTALSWTPVSSPATSPQELQFRFVQKWLEVSPILWYFIIYVFQGRLSFVESCSSPEKGTWSGYCSSIVTYPPHKFQELLAVLIILALDSKISVMIINLRGQDLSWVLPSGRPRKSSVRRGNESSPGAEIRRGKKLISQKCFLGICKIQNSFTVGHTGGTNATRRGLQGHL